MKIKFLIMIVLSFFLFCGCSSITEINKRSIVHAVGVDKNIDGYMVSLQIFSPSGNGSDTPIDVSKTNTKVVSATGETIYDAMRNCEKLLGSEAFMGHNKFVIFGESLYGEDMYELLGWFRKENQNYLGVTVGYSEGNAKDILNIKLTEGASAVENLELIHDYAVSHGTTAKGDLLVLFNDLALTSKSGFLPVFSVRDKESDENSNEQEKEQYLEINKTAVLKNGQVAGFLTSEEAQGVLWLTGELDKCKIVVEYNGNKIDVILKKRQVMPKIYRENGKIIADFEISAEARLVEDITEDEKLHICELSQKKILENCKKAIKKTVDNYQTDIINLEKLTKFYMPSLFKSNSENFFNIINSMEFRAKATCKIAN